MATKHMVTTTPSVLKDWISSELIQRNNGMPNNWNLDSPLSLYLQTKKLMVFVYETWYKIFNLSSQQIHTHLTELQIFYPV